MSKKHRNEKTKAEIVQRDIDDCKGAIVNREATLKANGEIRDLKGNEYLFAKEEYKLGQVSANIVKANPLGYEKTTEWEKYVKDKMEYILRKLAWKWGMSCKHHENELKEMDEQDKRCKEDIVEAKKQLKLLED